MADLNILKKYIETVDTSHAILLNGKWGSGKTHYWKNSIVPLVKKIPIPNSDKGKTYKPIYISLYGLENIEDISTKLLIESLPVNTKNKTVKVITSISSKIVKAASSFFQIGEVGLSPEDLANINLLKNSVIAFDDLERVSPNIIENVLGYINFLSEHENIKIILFADESKLKDHLEKWTVIKEKIISEELLFTPNYDEVISEILAKYNNTASQHYYQFLQENFERIKFAFFSSGTWNLRSLKFGIERFMPLFQQAFELNMTELPKDLLYTCICFSFEYKKGHITQKQDNGVKSISDSLIRERLFTRLKSHSANKTPDTEKPYDEIFYEQYFNNKNNYLVSDSFYDFIFTGNLSHTVVVDINDKYNSIDYTSKGVEALNALQYLGVIALEQIDFDKNLTVVFESIEEGIYSLVYYPIVYKVLLELSQNYLLVKSADEIKQLVYIGFKAYKSKNNHIYIPFIEQHLEGKFFQGDLKEFRDAVIQYNQDIYDFELKKKLKIAVDEIKSGGTSFLNHLYGGDLATYIHETMQYVDHLQFANELNKAPHSFIVEFTKRLKIRYRHGISVKEAEFFYKINDILKTLNSENTYLKKYYLTSLCFDIEELLTSKLIN